MSTYVVSGRFQPSGRGEWTRFETEVEATNEAVARERCLANLGSRHRASRQKIEIEEVEAQ